MVSTEDREIAGIATQAGAEVPFARSPQNANDFATTSDVLLEVLQQFEADGKRFEWFCCIYPTAPLIQPQHLVDAFQCFKDNPHADSLFSIVRFSYPVQRGLVIRKGMLKLMYPEYEKSRSQDLEPVYHDAGQFYWARTESFEKNGSLFSPHMLPYELPERAVQDIDTFEDWELAELKYRLRQKPSSDI